MLPPLRLGAGVMVARAVEAVRVRGRGKEGKQRSRFSKNSAISHRSDPEYSRRGAQWANVQEEVPSRQVDQGETQGLLF